MKIVSLICKFLIVTSRNLGSWARRTFYWLAYFPDLRFGKHVTIQRGVRFSVTDGGVIEIGAGTTICSNCLLVAKQGFVSIGKDSYIGPNTCIVSRAAITIGRDALIAERVSIRDQSHGMDSYSEQAYRIQSLETKKIDIKPNVWIGAGVFIAPGVIVEESAVIGANSAVTKSLQGQALYAGVPAKKIKTLNHGRD